MTWSSMSGKPGGELIVQPVAHGRRGRTLRISRESRASPCFRRALPQGRDRCLAKNFAVMTMAFPIQSAVTARNAE